MGQRFRKVAMPKGCCFVAYRRPESAGALFSNLAKRQPIPFTTAIARRSLTQERRASRDSAGVILRPPLVYHAPASGHPPAEQQAKERWPVPFLVFSRRRHPHAPALERRRCVSGDNCCRGRPDLIDDFIEGVKKLAVPQSRRAQTVHPSPQDGHPPAAHFHMQHVEQRSARTR